MFFYASKVFLLWVVNFSPSNLPFLKMFVWARGSHKTGRGKANFFIY